MSKPFNIKVRPLPTWLEWRRLLGSGDWRMSEEDDGRLLAQASLDRATTADLAARLRGVGIGGSLLSVEIFPPLHRNDLRRAYTEEARRYRQGSPGFSRPGVRLDDQARVSLTPESLALKLGERARGLLVLDACAGAGGNAIGFARAGCEVLAIEIDPNRLAMARHNAEIYGVAGRIKFICGDASRIAPEMKADLLFIDPPWGERYNKERVTLLDLPPCQEILDRTEQIPRKWIKVPPSFDPSTLPGCRPEAFFGVAGGDERRVKFLILEQNH